ncbi:YheC/YheD family protein [Shimazuella kribbensis]|uniref:YheC/YheD family endospore coat-associated protein n=1 Tax=Shimazuella kribbensis TaxID=139808 RepID=UPI0004274226|nr:YheC/YheD family protein [Shimazuella kribbensis]
MQIPNKGWLELDPNSSPLRFYPIKALQQSKHPAIDVTLGKGFPSKIQIQNDPILHRKSNHLPVRSKKNEQGNYQLGPFVAILTSDNRKPFAGNHRNFADLIQMGRCTGITVYVLTPKGILEDKSYVHGYLLEEIKPIPKFRKAILPTPDAVYNRIPYRQDEQSVAVLNAVQYLKRKNIPMFNPHFFNKWSLYQTLSPTSCRTHLPATSKLTDYPSFRQMMISHAPLILKPVEGKAGIGMMKVEGKGPYVLTHQTKKQKEQLKYHHLQQVYEQIKKKAANRGYLIQQAIELATYQDRPFDIRMLIQKDQTALWKVSGIGVRIAGKKAISTHVPMGGRIEQVDRVLGSAFPTQKEALQHQLTKLGIQFAQEIEEKTRENHGEMSMDIGIDTKGKLWFFEANAKPQKFDEPAIRTKSLSRILEYACFLAGFSSYPRRVVAE